jgi:hypothetical protein
MIGMGLAERLELVGRAAESSRLQPAFMSGRTTIFSGLNILAVSAMKRTPQKAITSASVACALRDRSRLSPTKSAMSWISGVW